MFDDMKDVAADPVEAPEDLSPPPEDRAHSFRERRLTYSRHRAASESVASDSCDDEGPPPPKKLKEDSPRIELPSRVLHAGELFRRPRLLDRRSPAKWRRRHSFCPSAPDHVLPFPRRVVGAFSCQGMEPIYDSDDEGAPRTTAKINQDRGGVAYPFAGCRRQALFACYDGHGEGGESISQYALHEVQRILEERLVQIGAPGDEASELEEEAIKKAFEDTFLRVDRALIDEPEIEVSPASVSPEPFSSNLKSPARRKTCPSSQPTYSGTTACVVLLRNDRLHVSNAGDSRAVLARRVARNAGASPDLVAIPLSWDQNPDVPGEMERILRCGGYVSPPPEPGLSARVWLDAACTRIGLAMARSIGDHAVKKAGVIAEPVVSTHDLGDDDEFLIVATDGVWEFLSSEEAVAYWMTDLVLTPLA